MREAVIAKRSYAGGTSRHRHAHHQIVLPLRGRMEMEIEGRGGHVDALTLAAVSAGEAHDFEAEAEGVFLVVDVAVRADDTGTGLWDAMAARPFLTLDPALQGFVQILGERMDAGDTPAEAGAAADLLLGALARRVAGPFFPRPLLRALAVMQADLAAPHRVEAVARAAGLSERRLHALFRAHLGTTPLGWLAGRRMEEARRRLLTTAEPVGAVAAAVGYDDPAAFARAFRRAHGVAPSSLRPDRQDRH